jgi:hypothetical protein
MGSAGSDRADSSERRNTNCFRDRSGDYRRMVRCVQDSGHSALVFVMSGLDFDFVAQDEVGPGVPGVGRGEMLAQLGDGGGGALGW